MYFAEAGFGGGSSIRLHALSDVLTTPSRTTSTVNVHSYAFPPDVPQQGGPPLDSVEPASCRAWSATAACGPPTPSRICRSTPKRSSAGTNSTSPVSPADRPRWCKSGNVDPGPGVHTWMAHVNVDNDGDMGIAFSVSGANQFAGIGYTGRLASDPLGTTRPVEMARAGEGSYSRFDSIGRNRWGDYSGLAVDPDGESFWLFNEYAAAGNNWARSSASSRWSRVRLAGPTWIPMRSRWPPVKQIGLSTITPFDDPIDSLNLLNPSLEILDPSGELGRLRLRQRRRRQERGDCVLHCRYRWRLQSDCGP